MRKNLEGVDAGFSPPAPVRKRLFPESEREVSAATNADKSDVLTSPLVRVLIIAAILLALGSMVLAALPLDALERVLAVKAHYRSAQIASFVDGHRLDIAVAGVATLLVAAVVALPTVTS